MGLLAERQARAAGLKPIEGDPGLPLLRKNHQLFLGTWMTDMSYYERFGEVTYIRALGIDVILATGPDAAASVLVNKEKAFANEPAWSFFIGPFFEGGLMLMDFGEHHRNRHIMQSAFTRDRLTAYLESMTPTIVDLVHGWGDTQQLEFYPAVKNLGLSIAVQTFMGDELGPDSDRVMRAFHDCIQAGTAVVRRPLPGNKWSRGLAGRRYLVDYLRPRVAAARANPGDDLLSALCQVEGENGERFTDDDVVAHMIFLIMAAHDTSTGTMAQMVYHLAKHPEWQDRCRKESEALGKDTIGYDDLNELPALDLVMKESLRLVSPLPVMARESVRDTELLGHFVPAGTKVVVTTQMNHSLPSVWSEPTAFDPERFAEGRREDQQHRFAFMPFGGGVHKCIGLYFGGMEITAVLHRMLLEYDWSVPADYEMPVSWKALPYPSDGLPITVSRR
ncbi:MAG TPA: cytochrome P450 [Nocardioidaceae bacterium]|nr:cytochrome P450 [Nocardioidaceae bacterium]